MFPTISNGGPDHSHVFDLGNPAGERNTLWAAVLTSIMMIAEIAGGWLFNSMALLADGWHMSSHTLALGLSVLAYVTARRYSRDARFNFGTWKIEVLGGYTSAVLLMLVAALMLYQSLERLFNPSVIYYNQAILLATLGLLVNVSCALLLKQGHGHGSDHEHAAETGGHDHHHAHDLNLRAAYLHVAADAATSFLAIFALMGGKYFAATWLDPFMGIVGAALVSVWAWGLLKEASRVLLDAELNAPLAAEIRQVIADSPMKAAISDLHLWRVGRGKYACILALQTSEEVMPAYFKERLAVHQELVHVTVEVNVEPRA